MDRFEYLASLPRKRAAASVLFFDESDRILLVEPTYKNHWELPGGVIEADESPRAGAIREIAEELALTISPGRLLAVDWVPPIPQRTEGLIFVYDGGTLSPAQRDSIRLPAEELRSWAWCDDEEAATRLTDLLARRAIAARQARAAGFTTYLEDGFAPA
ncbi:NUDIX domain-containing protein [Nocardia sp. NPDC020380]|uniref:NUDIX domain-containing protein n=1 Tax=Nocardia sp. NPDC020380 TaxID=3364309 RepID=UPI0037B882A2